MEKFFEHNPGFQSRIPYTLQFKDYEDAELLSMLQDLVEKQWGGRMKVEEGILLARDCRHTSYDIFVCTSVYLYISPLRGPRMSLGASLRLAPYSSVLKPTDSGSLYGRLAIRRLGRGRGRNGFGNARALRNLFDKIRERQSERLTKERRAGNHPDDFLLAKEDLIGPEPPTVIVQSKAWKGLQSIIGLDSVKTSVKNLFNMTISNYRREL